MAATLRLNFENLAAGRATRTVKKSDTKGAHRSRSGLLSNNPFDEPDHDRTVIRPSPGGRRAPPLPATPPPPPEPEPVAAAESDADRTVVRPSPGGRRALLPEPPPPSVPPPSAPPPSGPRAEADAAPIDRVDATDQIPLGDNPLIAAATPLLQLLARLRNTANPPDAGDLRARATAEIRRFERLARDSGVPMEQLRPAHYALCASLDDVVLNTPWGISGGWAEATLSSAFHHEATAGERFFDLLVQLRQRPAPALPVIELMYLCLSLGFMGRFREMPRGQAEIDRLRADVLATIEAERPPAEPELSPHWQGIDAPYRPAKARLPVWVVATACLAAIGAAFAFVSTSLNVRSDALYARTLSVAPASMPTIARAALVLPPPPPPPPPEPTAVDRLRVALKPQIDQGALTVLGTATTPVVRIASRVLFTNNSATLQSAAGKLLAAVATALRAEPGPIQAVGYTDNQPISTVQFPSNFQLSAARAQSVRTALGRLLGDAKRVSSEGRADSDPVATNATPEGRDQNRRVDLVLHR